LPNMPGEQVGILATVAVTGPILPGLGTSAHET
jgi:hypothetical protein